MAQQFRVRRRVGSVPITASGFFTLDLPRGFDYEGIFMRISASLVVSVAATSVRAEAPCQLVPRVEVVADGKTNLYSAPFWFSSLGSYDRALTQSGGRAITPPTGFAAATYAVEAIGTIDFATVDGVRPKDSNFRTSGLSLFQLRLTFGAPGDCFVGGTVAFSGSPVVEVWTSELVEVPDQNGQLPAIPFLRKVSFQDVAYPSSNSAAEIRVPAGNLLRSVLIRTDGSSQTGEPAINVLNRATLQSGVDVRADLSGAQIRAQNNADFGLVQLGYYILDVCSLGEGGQRLNELFDVSRQAEPKLLLDVTGSANARAQFVTTEYIPAMA
jgi:hypothetical protein